jgi:hypothetical protein
MYGKGVVISPQRSNILWGESLEFLMGILKAMRIRFLEQDITTVDENGVMVQNVEIGLWQTPAGQSSAYLSVNNALNV